MVRGVIQRRNSFDGRYWVRVRKSREKPGVARDEAGLRGEAGREGFDLTVTIGNREGNL